MKYGRHTAEVEAVIDLAKNGPILAPQHQEHPYLFVVHDFGEAKQMAWEKRYGQEELLWTDIREKEMSRAMGESYRLADFGEIRNELSALLKILPMYLRRRLTATGRSISDDIVADLYNCAVARAVHGRKASLFEQILDVYSVGGWPCGWHGAYPKGQLAAFFEETERQ